MNFVKMFLIALFALRCLVGIYQAGKYMNTTVKVTRGKSFAKVCAGSAIFDALLAYAIYTQL